ncbi:hypothetical protein [Synechococcus sp. BDU 130192]|uniref:hypothetical protein n=1 Tax=Synechococcus sp. BDU 130192 TaxID=2042059 RepID=UPI000C086D92|nr:hypothetical protein [Synechococcus sp. BDU 130192]
MNFVKIAAVAAGAAALSLGFASSAKAEFAASVSFVDQEVVGGFGTDQTGFSGSVAFGDGYAAAATGAAAVQIPFGPDIVITQGYAIGNAETSVFIEVNELNPFDGEEEVVEFTIGED